MTEKSISQGIPTESEQDTDSSEDEGPLERSFHLPDQPHLIRQNELNDLVPEFQLSKEKAQLLGSRLKEWNLLTEGTIYTHYRKRSEPFASFTKWKTPLAHVVQCKCQNKCKM